MKDTLCTWYKNISNLAILLCDIMWDNYKKSEIIYPILSVDIKLGIVRLGDINPNLSHLIYLAGFSVIEHIMFSGFYIFSSI